MSVPDTNARPPAPRNTITFTPSSASAVSHAACSPSYMSNVIALCWAGRSKVTVKTAPSRLDSQVLAHGVTAAARAATSASISSSV